MMDVYQSPNLITPSSQTLSLHLPSPDIPIPCSSYTISHPDCQERYWRYVSLSNLKYEDISLIYLR